MHCVSVASFPGPAQLSVAYIGKTDLVILHSFLRSSNYKQVLKHIHSYICIPPTTASVHVHYTKMLIMNATVSRRARSRVYFNLQHNRISGTYNIREYCHPVHRQKKTTTGRGL